ncbi:MAG: hypothetical protein ACXAD7_27880 [Candidatus Kariarchaeaceae archaeon]|jgi:hypothetical protein
MKRKIFLFTSFTFLILYLMNLPSSSFIVRPLPGAQHHNIVYSGLTRIGGFGGIPFYEPLLDIRALLAYFTEDCDLNELTDGWDWLHFRNTSCWTVARDNRIANREAAAFLAAMWDQNPGSPDFLDDACWYLGQNFHCVADFYAHSNWVETHAWGVIADLEAQQPPSGWGMGYDKDKSSHPLFPEAFEDAVLTTIREWYLFEDKVYEMFPDSASSILHSMGVSSQINTVHSPKAGEGHILGDTHKIIWYQSAIPHDTLVDIKLLMNGSPLGIIDTVPIHDNQYSWIVGDYQGGQADPNNTNPCYQIQIRTLDGQYSATSGNFHINEAIKGAPTNLIAMPTAWNRIKLIWNDGSNCEDRFEIKRKKEGDPNFTHLKSVGINTYYTEDTTAIPGTTYYYIVKAVFWDGTYAFGNQTSAQIPDDTEPYELDDLDARFDYGSVELMWSDPCNNEQEFIIERSSEWDPWWDEIATVGQNCTHYSDYTVEYDTFYYYRVRAYNPNGYSSYTMIAEVYIRW